MSLFFRFRVFFRRSSVEAEMAEEMRLHLEQRAEESVADGMSPENARYAALRQFGGVEQIKEQCRDRHPWVRVELLLKEFRFAARSLRRAPGFSLAVLTTLALCIGPNTAILSVLYGLVYKPLPFHEPHRLVYIGNIEERAGGAKRPGSIAQYQDFAEHADRFEGFTYFNSTNATIGEEDDAPLRGPGMQVSANFLRLVRLQPALGRGFLPEEQQDGANRVVMLSHGAWRKRHNSSPQVIGRQIQLDSQPYTIVGVAPAAFEELFNDVEFWRPFIVRPGETNLQTRYAGTVRLLGRLKPGVSFASGQAQLEVLERSFYQGSASPEVRKFVDKGGYRISAIDAHAELAEPVKRPLLLLQCGAALVLLISCVNVASLLLARINTKRAELAIRQALGAGQGALLRHLMAESVLLVGAAGAIGVGLAYGMLRWMNHYLPTVVRHVPPVGMNIEVLQMALIGIVVIVVAMGVIPFTLLTRSGLRIGETPRTSIGRRGRDAISALVVLQVALAMMLLIGAGLLIHSFARVISVSPGFDAEHIVQSRVTLPYSRYKDPKDNIALQGRMLEAMKSIPGVDAVSLSTDFGVAANFRSVPLRLLGGAPETVAQPMACITSVSPDFFTTMSIPLHDGRLLQNSDDFRAHPVAVVDQAFVDRYFAGGIAVGRQFTLGSSSGPSAAAPAITIVGVVARANLTGLEARDGLPFIYVPFNQQPILGFTLIVRSNRSEADLVNEMRTRLRAIDPRLPFSGASTLANSLDSMLGNRRALMVLLGLVAALALCLAAVGLYGVLNYDVSQRTKEIGIRGAIGATREQIVAMILREGMLKAGLGLAVGGVGALLFTRFLSKMLFDVGPRDPVAFGGVAGLLLAVAIVASWIPARRAARVDPMMALRCE